MTLPDYKWVQGDHEELSTTITDEDGTAVDLTGRTPYFVLRTDSGAKVADKAATVDDAVNGKVTVDLTPTNLATPYGHEAEWRITGGANDPTTYPKDEAIIVEIRPNVHDSDDLYDPLPDSRSVETLYADELNGGITGDVPLTTIAGNALSITNEVLNVSGVGVSDLAFDPATQTELDSHDHTGDTITPTSVETSSVNNDDYHETVVSGSVTGTTGLDLSAANFFDHTLTGNTTFEFNNPQTTPPGNSFTLIVQQDSTGGHSITWPTSVEWDRGSAPSLSTNANDKHMLGFISPDGGTTWIGVVSAEKIA